MYDIVHPQAAQEAKLLGIKPLVIGEDVLLISNKKELKNTAPLIVLGKGVSRELIESPIDGIVYAQANPRKDHLHFRRGLDQVNANILSQHTRALIIDLQSIREAPNSHVLIGRMLQNVEMADKAGAPVLFVSFAKEFVPNPHDLEAFFIGVGVPERIVKKHQAQFVSWVERAQSRAGEKYVGEGVQRL